MKRLIQLATISLLGLTMAGCSLTDDDDDNAVEPTAELRVLHGSADAPDVDVLVNDKVVLQGVPYEAASGYLEVPANGMDVKINAAGTSTTALALDNVVLTPDTPYTVIAANSLANIEAIVLDDSTIAPGAGNLLLRVVHATATAPAVDVYVTAPADDLVSATPAVANASFKDASGFLEIPAGDYRIRVTSTSTQTVLFDSGTVALETAAQLTVVALPSTNKVSPIDLVALTGDSAASTILLKDNRAQLRAAHLSPDAPNVDIYVDGSKILTDVPFKAASDYLLVQSGNHQLVVTPTGTTTAVIDIPLNLEAMSVTTAAVVNFVANIEALALEDDLTTPEAGTAHLRVVHASPDAPNVDVLLDGNQVLSDVPFKGISAYLPVTAGSHTVTVNVTGTSTSVIDAPVTLDDGAIYTIFAVGAAASIEPLVVKDL